MDCTKTGELIAKLRREKSLTQLQLAERIGISDKAVSKWERGLGYPDLTLWPALSTELGVQIEEMLSGELSQNALVSGNMKKALYYVCPVCGNVLQTTGEATIVCCGRRLEALVPRKAAPEEKLLAEPVEDELYITGDHPMEKDHFISFVAFATGDRIQFIKLYPEWNLQLRIHAHGHGMLLWYCTRHGLMYQYL